MPARALVLLAFAAPALAQAPAQPVVPQQMTCTGDTATWRLDAGRATATLKRAGGKIKQQLDLRGEMTWIAEQAPNALVWRGSSTHLPAEVVVATARELACKPGASPAAGWQAVVSLRAGEALAGCCVVKRGYDAAKAPLAAFAQKKDDDWSRRWPEIGAAVQRCASETGTPVREVAKAWSLDADNVMVRMTAVDGRPMSCTMAARGKPKIVPLSVGDALPPGANAPVYYPAREAPIVACGRLERIAAPGPRARTEGWLHYDRC